MNNHIYNAQLTYDNTQEPEISRDEALFERRCQRADKIAKELRADPEQVVNAFITYISEYRNDEQLTLIYALVEHSLEDSFDHRDSPINQIVNMAIDAKAFKMADQDEN
jgi:hypothetical protein